jgi:hypothetical protein
MTRDQKDSALSEMLVLILMDLGSLLLHPMESPLENL